MKKLPFLSLFISLIAFSQQFDVKKFEDFKTRSIGPAGMSGRVTAIDVVTEDPDIIYVGTASGGEGSGLYITYNGGEDWKKLTEKDGLPEGNLGRIGLAIAPSNPKFVYALVEAKKNALYKSEDGGFKWKMVNDQSSGRGSEGIGNRPFYYADIFVDPLNENRIYSLFTYVNISEDGGKSFQQLMPAYGTTTGVHPDHHAWYIHPTKPNFMIDGNDGGLYITRDRGKTWRFAENLPLAQFYHVNVDMEFPYNVYGGLQDNGSWVGPAYVLKSQGIRNSYWQEIMFGDGFDAVPDPKDSRFGYAMSQQGSVGRYDRLTGNTKNIKPTHPNPDIKLRFNWNAAIAINPTDNETIYFGSQFVHKSADKGFTWEIISPDLTTNNKEKQKQHESGGITMDATGAENHCTILAIEPSILDENLLWVGTDDGNIQLTLDGGTTWANVSKNIKDMPKESWVAQIRASKFNKGEAYAVVNNYRQFDFKPYLFRTRDYGKTWENIVAGKDEIFGYTLSLAQDLEVQNLLFLGTENGLYISIDEGKTWTKWTNNYPTVSTMDLAIHPREHDLIIGTFGRAIYILDDIRPFRAMAKEGKSILDKPLYLFSPPNTFITQNQEASGTRFGANAIFNGENRPRGAMITYSINRPEIKKSEIISDKNKKGSKITSEENAVKSEKPEVKYDSILFQVYNDKKELIRSISKEAPKKNGVYRLFWNLDEKGLIGPSRKAQKPNKSEPSGVTVLPGTYAIEIHFGNQKTSENIKVDYDPRVAISFETLKSKYDLLKQLEAKKGVAGEATQRLLASKEIVEDYQKRIKKSNLDAKENQSKKDTVTIHSEISKKIEGLLDAMLGKEDKRQGITATEFPSTISYLYMAAYYVDDLLQKPGKTEYTLVKNADEKVSKVIDEINAFYKTDWVNYKNAVEKLNLSPFKELDELKY